VPKVLIVDDNQDVLISMRLLLQCAGYAVRTAQDGSEGLRLYQEDPPDVVITDLAMPEMDGIEMMVKIREKYPASRIVAISGFSEKKQADYLSVAKAVGAIETFVKPVESNVLLEKLDSLIGSLSA
jgi:YesN/AraC family two-component response regulator